MACIVMIVQLVLTSYVSGTLLHMLQFKDNSLELHKEKMARLKLFCHQRGLPNGIYDELVDHFEFQVTTNQRASDSRLSPWIAAFV
eukprot:2023464-Pyramimonas_sp.AAC.1